MCVIYTFAWDLWAYVMAHFRCAHPLPSFRVVNRYSLSFSRYFLFLVCLTTFIRFFVLHTRSDTPRALSSTTTPQAASTYTHTCTHSNTFGMVITARWPARCLLLAYTHSRVSTPALPVCQLSAVTNYDSRVHNNTNKTHCTPEPHRSQLRRCVLVLSTPAGVCST